MAADFEPSNPKHPAEMPPLSPPESALLARRNGRPAEGAASENLDLSDVQTRRVLEQLLAVLSQDSAPSEEKVARTAGLTDYLLILRRRWLPMLAIMLVVFPMVVWRLKPGETTYVATATVLPPKSVLNTQGFAQTLAGGTDGAGGAGGAVAPGIANASLETQIAIMTSPQLVARALGQLTPLQREQGWGNPETKSAPVSASTPISSDMIDVTVTASDPQAAVALTNTLIDTYVDRTQELADASNKAASTLMIKRMEEAKDLLVTAQRELQNFREQTGVIDLSQKMTSTATRIDALEEAAAAAAREVAQARSAPLADEGTAPLQQRVSEARQNFERVQRDFLPTAPEFRKAQQELRDAERILNERVAAKRNAALMVAQTRARMAQEELNKAKQGVSHIPSLEFKYNQLRQNVDLLEKTYQAVVDRYTNLTLERVQKTATVTVLTPAKDATPINQGWQRAIFSGLFVALALAAMVAALLEHLDNSVRSVEDLEAMKIPVLSAVPMVETPMELRLAYMKGQYREEKSLLEAYRILRTNLSFASLDQPPRSLLITSAVPSEGKSMSALNLATAIAYDGKKVILVDLDLRRPSQHRLNGITIKPGFTSVLSGTATLEEALQPTPAENLQILPSGPLPPNPPELLGSMASRHLIEELTNHCDVLIIDSPPLLSLTDSQVLASIADGVVLVVAADTTARQQVQRAQGMLRSAGGNLFGVVFNKVKAHNDPYGYYYYYRYYSYGEGKDDKRKPALGAGGPGMNPEMNGAVENPEHQTADK